MAAGMGAGMGMAAGGQLMNMGMEAAFNAAEKKADFKIAKKLARHAISWRVQDLQRAGLNPLLAIAGGLGGSNANMSHGQSASSDVGGQMHKQAESMQSGAARRLLEEQAAKVADERNLIRTQQKLNLVNAQILEAQRAGSAITTEMLSTPAGRKLWMMKQIREMSGATAEFDVGTASWLPVRANVKGAIK